MIKRYFIIFFILIPAFSGAQLYIGAKVGYSPLSTVSFKPSKDATPFYGGKPDFGLIVKYFDQKWFGLQAEVNFTQRGYNAPFKEIYKERHVSDYIETPFLTQLQIGFIGIKVHAQAGFYLAYLLNSKHGVDSTGTMVLKPYSIDMLRDNRFDYGLVAGGGLSKEFKWGVIQVDIRIQYGYGDIYKHSYKNNPYQSKAIVQNVSISYLYNISNLFKKQKQEINP